MILTQEVVNRVYSKFKKIGVSCFERGLYSSSLKYLESACDTAYKFYLGFTDKGIEDTLKQLSEKVKKKPYNCEKPRCVFYDTFSQDAQGLTMQYVEAIIAAGWEFLYITEFGLNDSRSVKLKQIICNYPKARLQIIPRKTRGLRKIQLIYDSIIEYAPDKLFMHIHPSAVEAVTAFYALPKDIIKYQINLTDHTFWIGAGCVDYTFEFREYGASLSVSRRGFSESQVLLLPYYPMMKKSEFRGFPKESDGKVKIFSGANYYKIIDENDTFFKINKAILDANPNAVTLFAGGGDLQMLEGLIVKYGLQGRFIPIGHRDDIFECYKHSDIYLNTYPLFGGLMGQMAAHAALPILSFAKKGAGVVEEVICQKRKAQISFYDKDDFLSEANRLINDTEYRKQRGLTMKNSVISIEEFNRNFVECVLTKQSPYRPTIDKNVHLHYLNVEDKLRIENKTKRYQQSVVRTIGCFRSFLCVNPIWRDGIYEIIRNSSYFQSLWR